MKPACSAPARSVSVKRSAEFTRRRRSRHLELQRHLARERGETPARSSLTKALAYLELNSREMYDPRTRRGAAQPLMPRQSASPMLAGDSRQERQIVSRLHCVCGYAPLPSSSARNHQIHQRRGVVQAQLIVWQAPGAIGALVYPVHSGVISARIHQIESAGNHGGDGVAPRF